MGDAVFFAASAAISSGLSSSRAPLTCPLLFLSLFFSGGVRAVLPQRAPQLQMKASTNPAAAGMLAASLAMALNAGSPQLARAVVEPPAVVQQYGSSMIADADAELRDAQRKFLEEREKIKQTYDTDVESTFVGEAEFADKKNIYVTIVGGLVVVAFLAPMLQFFYYTGGD